MVYEILAHLCLTIFDLDRLQMSSRNVSKGARDFALSALITHTDILPPTFYNQ